MTDFPPAWPKWLPLAREVLAHLAASGSVRQYGAGGEAKEQLEQDAKRIAKALARRLPPSAAPLDGD